MNIKNNEAITTFKHFVVRVANVRKAGLGAAVMAMVSAASMRLAAATLTQSAARQL